MIMTAPTPASPTFVIPAKAGTQSALASRMTPWVPAFAGMTSEGVRMIWGGAAL